LDTQSTQTTPLQKRFSHTLQTNYTEKPDYTKQFVEPPKSERLFNKIESQAAQLVLSDIQPTQTTHLQKRFSETLQTDCTDKPDYTKQFVEPWTLSLSPQQYLSKLFQLTKEWNRAMQVLLS
jgi:hypothetical protein